MKCFKCNKKIKKDKYNILYNAIEFQGHPGYGSNLNGDTLDGNDYLELSICDSCIKNNVKNVKRYKIKIINEKEYSKKVIK